eukprot:scaffold37946_cov72-Phaeocystis_antarctica.AAC.4
MEVCGRVRVCVCGAGGAGRNASLICQAFDFTECTQASCLSAHLLSKTYNHRPRARVCVWWLACVCAGRCVCSGLRGAQTSKEVVPSSMAINRSLRGILRMKIINIAPRGGGVCSVAGGGVCVPTNKLLTLRSCRVHRCRRRVNQ